MSARDIFVSYAREDQTQVALVVAALEAHGWSVFWDRRIPAGQTWRSHIGRALNQAHCVVVAWSEHSIQSDFVIEEAARGQRRHILVPVLLDLVDPPLGFGEIHAADLSGWSPERPSPAFDNFLADLGAVLGAPQQGPSPPSPAAETSPGKRAVGGGVVANPLAGSMVDAPRAAETPVLPAGQPAHAVDATAQRAGEADPPPLSVGEERPAETLPPSGLSRPTEATHPASFDEVLAEQVRSRRAGPKSKAGRRWLGMALAVGGISAAGGSAYLGLRPPPEPAPANPEAARTAAVTGKPSTSGLAGEDAASARPATGPAVPVNRRPAPSPDVAAPSAISDATDRVASGTCPQGSSARLLSKPVTLYRVLNNLNSKFGSANNTICFVSSDDKWAKVNLLGQIAYVLVDDLSAAVTGKPSASGLAGEDAASARPATGPAVPVNRRPAPSPDVADEK